MLNFSKNNFIFLMTMLLLFKKCNSESLRENVIKVGKTILENDFILSNYIQNNVAYESEEFNNTQCINQLNALVSSIIGGSSDIWALQGRI